MNAALAPAAVTVRRTISASAEQLFDAWMNPYALSIWMRPSSVRDTRATVEARVGGSYEIVMRTDAASILHKGVYVLIDRPRKLVFTWISPYTDNSETLVTVDFLPAGERTEVVVTHEKLPEQERAGHEKGWSSALEHLAEDSRRGLLPGA